MVKRKGEIWKAHPRWQNYMISSDGRVCRDGGVCLRCTPSKDGYVYVSLPVIEYGRIVWRSRPVHRLVLETFVGPGDGMWVDHENEIKHDNRLENLEWTTPKENSDRYMARHGNPMDRLDVKERHLEAVNTPQYKEKMSRISKGIPKSKRTRKRMSVARESIVKKHIEQGKVRVVTYKGKTRTLREWSKRLGIPTPTLADRYNRGLPPEKILLRTRTNARVKL